MTRGNPVPHYERPTSRNELTTGQGDSALDDDEDAMEGAAQALREAEVEAVRPITASEARLNKLEGGPQLEKMSIDELRALAAKLDVPNRGAIIEQDQLIAAIRERM
jgi:hypothetical protein